MRKLQRPVITLVLLLALLIGAMPAFAIDADESAAASVADASGSVVIDSGIVDEDSELSGDPDDAITGNRGPASSGSSGSTAPLVEEEDVWLMYFLAWIQGLIINP